MKASMKSSILKYLKSKISLRFLPTNKVYWFLLCSWTPLLLTSWTVISVAAPPKLIAQVNTQTTSINRPTLQLGSQGQPVSELQAALKLLGFYTGSVDGVYNQTTANAVSQFKQAAGLKPDGIVDANTWQRLFPNEEATVASNVSSPNSAKNFPVPTQTANTPKVVSNTPEPKPATPAISQKKPPAQSSSSSEPRPAKPTTSQNKPTAQSSSSTRRQQNTRRSQQSTNSQQNSRRSQQTNNSQRKPGIQYTSDGLPILRLGMRGSEVLKLQQRLQKLGYFKGEPDGDFGENTQTAVIAFQKRYGIEADGVVGGETWQILQRRR